VKFHTHLTNSSSTSSCKPRAWTLPPAQLLVLPSGEPRNETTSFSHQFIFQLNEFPSRLCCTAPDSCIRGKDQWASAIYLVPVSNLSLQPHGLLHPALLTIPPPPLSVPVTHTELNITEIIWTKYKIPREGGEATEEFVNQTAEKNWIITHKGLS